MEKLMTLIDLRAGYDSLHRALEGEPSKYAAILVPAPEMNDSIPDFAPQPEEAAE